MILLFGGTSETAGIATALAENGHKVLVSTATDAPLEIGDHPAIKRRCGRLDEAAIVELIRRESIRVVVDGSHPYAVALHATVAVAAQQAKVPCFRYQRKTAVISGEDGLYFVADHDEAAALAVKLAVPVLLTTGSRQLVPYIEVLRKHNIPLYARVLPHPESEQACDLAGLPLESRIVGRGPFSEAENCQLIRSKNIGVLITKDSGSRGGVAEKISAAGKENCRVIVIQRPLEELGYSQVFTNVGKLVAAVGDAQTS
jgi:precorrin-6A/cobalt-precorrin-6A reductase